MVLKHIPLDTRFDHHAHHADLVRLEALYTYGGLYLDIDTVSCTRLDVMSGGTTIGFQNGPPGLCNAIIACAPRSNFILKWINTFENFKNGPLGTTGWDYQAIKVPLKLATRDPNVLITGNWHRVHWSDCKNKLFDTNVPIDQPVYHLCESMYYDELTSYTLNDIVAKTCTYTTITKHLCELPLVVHMTWKNNDIPEPLQKCIQSWKKHYDVVVWTDDTLRALIESKMPAYLSIFDEVKGILKAGLGRLIVIYLFGGIYADLDIELLSPIPPRYLKPFYINIAMEPLGHAQRLCDAFFASTKGNPYLLRIIDEGVKNNSHDACDMWGPNCWTRVLPPNSVNKIPSELVYPIRDASQSQFTADIQILETRDFGNAFCVHYWCHSNWPRDNMLGIEFGEPMVVTDNEQFIDKYKLAWNPNGTLIGYVSGGKIFSHDGEVVPLGSVVERKIVSINKHLPLKHAPLEPLECGLDEPTGEETLTWIVAVYNRVQLVKHTIDSIKAQTVPFKCILCDDGSDDGSIDYVRSLIVGDDRFSFIANKHSGYPTTCRQMNDRSETDIVAIIDSDDVLAPNATAVLLDVYRTQKCVMVVSSRYECDASLNIQSTSILNTNDIPELEVDQMEHIRSWRKKCLSPEAFKGDILCAEDRDLFYKMEELGKIIKLTEPLVYVRHHPNSIMSNPDGYRRARHDHCMSKVYAISRRTWRCLP